MRPHMKCNLARISQNVWISSTLFKFSDLSHHAWSRGGGATSHLSNKKKQAARQLNNLFKPKKMKSAKPKPSKKPTTKTQTLVNQSGAAKQADTVFAQALKNGVLVF